MNHPSELPRGFPRKDDDLVLTGADLLDERNDRPEYAIIYGLVALVIVGVIGLAWVLA